MKEMIFFKPTFVFFFLLTSCTQEKNWTCSEGNCDNGFGTRLWKDGGFEKGNWKNGKLQGSAYQFFGKTSKFARDTYEGEFSDDKFNGKGVYHGVQNGSTYAGYWKDGKPNGKGKVVFDERSEWANEYYDGDWLDGKRAGLGVGVFSLKKGGGTYIGEWNNDKREGKGKHIYPSGDFYEGGWLNDVKHGSGIHTDSNGRAVRLYCQNGHCESVKER